MIVAIWVRELEINKYLVCLNKYANVVFFCVIFIVLFCIQCTCESFVLEIAYTACVTVE